MRQTIFSYAYLMLVCVFTLMANTLTAQTFDFEDAHDALDHGGDPASFYTEQGLTIRGDYFGIIEGVSRGDTDRFNLEGTNGAAALAINDLSHSIILTFSSQQSRVCVDIGTAFFSQLPNGATINVQSFNGSALNDNDTVFVQDTLRQGEGEWATFEYTSLDKLVISAQSGSSVWAIDNIRLNQFCDVTSATQEEMLFVVPTSNGNVVIFTL